MSNPESREVTTQDIAASIIRTELKSAVQHNDFYEYLKLYDAWLCLIHSVSDGQASPVKLSDRQ